MKTRVIIESPYKGKDWSETKENIEYAKECLKDSLAREEAPIASHLLYTMEGLLDDTITEERELGIEAGLTWIPTAKKSVVYIDRGISKGMLEGIHEASLHSVPIVFRRLYDNPFPLDSIIIIASSNLKWTINFKEGIVDSIKPATNDWMPGITVEKLLTWAIRKKLIIKLK